MKEPVLLETSSLHWRRQVSLAWAAKADWVLLDEDYSSPDTRIPSSFHPLTHLSPLFAWPLILFSSSLHHLLEHKYPQYMLPLTIFAWVSNPHPQDFIKTRAKLPNSLKDKMPLDILTFLTSGFMLEQISSFTGDFIPEILLLKQWHTFQNRGNTAFLLLRSWPTAGPTQILIHTIYHNHVVLHFL